MEISLTQPTNREHQEGERNMSPLKKFLAWLRDPFGDRRTLERQEYYHNIVLTEIEDIGLSRYPYKALRKECREASREGTRHVR